MAFFKTEKFYTGNNILSSEIGLVLKTKEGTPEGFCCIAIYFPKRVHEEI